LLKKLNFSEFIEIYANLCYFFDVFRRIFLAHIAHAPQIDTPTPIFSPKTNIRSEMNLKNLKKPQFPPIPDNFVA